MPDINAYSSTLSNNVVYLNKCKHGMGLKICEIKDENENHVGIFVKQVLEGGIAAKSSEIDVGDKLLAVNGQMLNNFSQVEAITCLRNAAQKDIVKLRIDKSQKARNGFLQERGLSTATKQPCITSTPKAPADFNNNYMKNISESLTSDVNDIHDLTSGANSEIFVTPALSPLESFKLDGGGAYCGSKNDMLLWEQHNFPIAINSHLNASADSGFPQNSPFRSSRTSENRSEDPSNLRSILIQHNLSLGITTKQGRHPTYGDYIYVSEIIENGDVQQDGQLEVGDVLVSIDGESFVGVDNDKAKSILARIKLRKNASQHFISYVPKELYNNDSRELNTSPRDCYRKSVSNITPSDLLSEMKLSSIHHVTSERRRDANSDPHLNELLTLMGDIEDSDAASDIASEILNENKHIMPVDYHTLNMDGHTKDNSVSSISHYLSQDVKVVSRKDKQKKRRKSSDCFLDFSLDPSTAIKIEKLEMALKHLGLKFSSREYNEIRRKLKLGRNGVVLYGDFVEAVKEVLDTSLKDCEFPASTPAPNFNSENKIPISTFKQMVSSIHEEVYKLRAERDEALKEAQNYRSLIKEKDLTLKRLQQELDKSKQEMLFLRDQCISLQKRMKLSKSTERSTKEQENIYEETIHKLEEEVSTLKSKGSSEETDYEEIHQRSVVLGCQLRKAEVSKRTYEVAVNKMMKFLEKVQMVLSKEEKRQESETSHRKARKLNELVIEAKQTIQTVNALIEEDPLPYGWEEVYSPDGSKYYINHVNQLTSWSHPVTGVQHSQNSSKK